ncbi:MAG TPA: efflux RND transporter periplasmic adaptor subunit [Gemmatimonadaceae bacterium]|nr:efflux RND transporter periplasmic adaptor subunit [Gemmatimonadaceae bacterium]
MTTRATHALAFLLLLGACGRAADRPPPRGSPDKRGQAGDAIVVGDRARVFAGLQFAEARPTMLERQIRTTGVLAWDPSGVIDVTAPVRGRILELRGTVGDRVAAGAVVAVLDNPDNLNGRFEVHAASGGVIAERATSVGSVVDAGTRLLRVVDDARIWLLVDIPPTTQDRPRIGSEVSASVPAAGATIGGRIDAILPQADSTSHVVRGRVPIANPRGSLTAGMSALVTASTGARVAGVVIPRSAVVYAAGRQIVFVPDSGSAFHAVAVQTGMPVAPDDVSVLRGLAAGTRVVSVGAQQLANQGFNFKGLGDDEEDEETP